MRGPRGVRHAVAWRAKGSFNGRRVHYELVVDHRTWKILHHQFRGR